MTTPGISDPPINYWTTSTYDAADQQLDEQRTGSELNSSTSSQFQYDLNGNRVLETKVQGASTLLATYLWDPSNRLAVVQDLGYVLTNTYRPDGMRHRTVDNFSANVMVRDKNDVLATVDDTGALVQFFTRGARAVKRYNSPSSAMFYHCDALGTMQAYSNPDGTTFERVVLDAWGGNTQAMSVDVHSYVGDAGYWGVGGLQRPLYYVRARWLVAGGPGWLSPDPAELVGADRNRYLYVRNEPTVAVDPSGLQIRLVHPVRNPFGLSGPSQLDCRKSGPPGVCFDCAYYYYFVYLGYVWENSCLLANRYCMSHVPCSKPPQTPSIAPPRSPAPPSPVHGPEPPDILLPNVALPTSVEAAKTWATMLLEQLAEVSQDAAKLNEWVSQLDDLYDKLQCVDRGKVEEVKESLEDVARAASQQSPGDVVGACLGLCHNVIEWLSGCTLTGKYATALMLLANEYCGPFSSLCERHI